MLVSDPFSQAPFFSFSNFSLVYERHLKETTGVFSGKISCVTRLIPTPRDANNGNSYSPWQREDRFSSNEVTVASSELCLSLLCLSWSHVGMNASLPCKTLNRHGLITYYWNVKGKYIDILHTTWAALCWLSEEEFFAQRSSVLEQLTYRTNPSNFINRVRD